MAKKRIATYLKEAIASGFKHIKRRFNNLKELNINFHKQRKWIFDNVSKRADYKRRLVKVLEVLKLHSCKHIGISWLTENHLCVAYEEQFGESISKRTVSTYMEHLRELGMISTIPTKRKDGKQSANIIVLEKLDDAKSEEGRGVLCPEAAQSEKPNGKQPALSGKPAYKEEENLHTKITTSSFKTTVKEHKERKAKKRQLLNFVPDWFKEKIACCATEAKSVYEYWKVAKHLTQHVFDKHIDPEDKPIVIRAAISEYYKAAKAASKGKFCMQNPYGFFHAVLAAEASAHVRRQGQTSRPSLYNWLEV